MSTKVKDCWNDYAAGYSALLHTESKINNIIKNPVKAFHHTTWEMVSKAVPDLKGKKICVPSSGDIEEMLPEKDYDNPFWISLSEQIKGVTATKEEVDRMYDYKIIPQLALPEMISIIARK